MPLTAAQVQVKFSSTGADKVKADAKGVEGAVNGVNQSGKGFLSGALQGAVGFFGGELMTRGVTTLGNLGRSFLTANADAETLRVGLEVATGSAAKADTVFNNLMSFAQKTPFEFPELANSARMLETFGISSEKWIPIIGNTAAATGKSIDEVTNAMLDAQTGEFERLKELGIRTVEENGQLYFQYMDKNGKLVKKAIDRNNPDIINSTLEGIWNDQYGGAMDKMSTTFAGKLSTLKDNVSLLMQQMSKPIFEWAKSGLGMANTFFDEFGRLSDKGLSPMAAAFEAFKDTLSLTFGESANGVRTALTSIVGVIGQVAGLVGSVLSAAFSLVANNMDVVVGAIKGLAAGFAGMLAWGAITGVLGAIGSALAFIVSPIGLVIAALALLGIAYEKNFMGFGDAVRGALKAVSQFASGFKKAFSALEGNPLEKVLQSIAAGLRAIGGENTPAFLEKLAGAFDAVAAVVHKVTSIFQSFRDSGLSPLQAAFATLSALMPSLSGAFDSVYSALMNLKEAFTDLINGDFAGFFSNLGQAAMDGARAIGQAFMSYPWAELWDGIKQAWDSIEWAQMGREAINFIVDAFRSPTVTGIFQWITDALQDALRGMGTALQTGLQVAWSAISELDWGRFIPNIDWGRWLGAAVDLAILIGGKIKDLPWGDWISGAVDLITLIGGKIKNLPWGDWVSGAVDLITLIGGKIKGLPWGDWVSGAVDLITLIGGKIKDLPWGDWVSGTVDLAVTVAGKIKDLPWGDWISGAVDLGVEVVNKITSLPWGDWVSGTVDLGVEVVSKITSLPWGDWVSGTVDLAVEVIKKITSLPWSDWVSGTVDLAVEVVKKIKSLPWGDWVSGSVDLATKVPEKIKGLPWSDWVSGAVDLATKIPEKIASLPWGDFVSGIADIAAEVGKKITNIPWPSAADILGGIPWPDLPNLEWPSKDELLNALVPGNPFGGEDTADTPVYSGGGGSGTGGVGGSGGGYGHYLPYSTNWDQPLPPPDVGGGGGMGLPTSIPAPDITAFLGAITIAKAAVVSFVADTIGVMGGWIGGISTMMSTFSSVFHPPISMGTSAGKQSFITFVADTIAVMGGWVGGITTIVTTASSALTSTTSSSTSAGKQSYIAFVSSTIAVMGGWVGGITNIVNTVSNTLKSQSSSATSSAKSSFVSFVSSTIAVMGGWSSGIKNQVSSAMDSLRSQSSSATSSARSSFSSMVSSIRGSMNEASGAIRAAASGWAGIIQGAAGGLFGAGQYAGSQAGAGVAAGLRGSLGSVQAAANQIIATVDAAMRKAGQIRSPSRLTAEIGRYLTEGVSRGILDGRALSQAASAAREAIHRTYAAMSTRERLTLPPMAFEALPTTLPVVGAGAATAAGARAATASSITYTGDILIQVVQQPGQSGADLAEDIFRTLAGGVSSSRVGV